MPAPNHNQLYAPHRNHGLRLSGPDDIDPEIFSVDADADDLSPYEHSRRTVDGDDDSRSDDRRCSDYHRLIVPSCTSPKAMRTFNTF
jgi:hypothetical protein